MKKIILILLSLAFFVITSQLSFASNYNYDKSCTAGYYYGYTFTSLLADGSSTYATKEIYKGTAYSKISCNNGILSRKIIRISCDSGYIRSSNYCQKKSNYTNNSYSNNQNTSYVSDRSCTGGYYYGYTFTARLASGRSVNATKEIYKGTAYSKITCNDGKLSRKIIRITCDSGYSRSSNYCQKNSNYTTNNYSNNRNNNYVNSKSCTSGYYYGYTFTAPLADGRSVNATKEIYKGTAYAKITCNDGRLSRKIIRITCDSGYSRSSNYCQKNSNYTTNNYSNNRNNNYINSKSCTSGYYYGYTFTAPLADGRSVNATKEIYKGTAYSKITCNDGRLSRKIIRITCDSGYSRSSNYCQKN